jgi:hypothetical protein
VGVLGDLMLVRARLIDGVDMHDDAAEKAYVVQELVADLLGWRATLPENATTTN